MTDFSRVHFCFSLPRSRTQWLCWLYGKNPTTIAWHDPLRNYTGPHQLIDAVTSFLCQYNKHTLFIADTSALMFHDALSAGMPGMHRYYVARDEGDVIASIQRHLPSFNREDLIYRMAERLEYQDSVAFEDLDRVAWEWLPQICPGVPMKGPFVRQMIIKANMRKVDNPLHLQAGDSHRFKQLLRYSEI